MDDTGDGMVQPSRRSQPRILVLGLNDVASAVAHRLFSEGYATVLQAPGPPKTHRRRMAFADAYWDGRSDLQGVTCHRTSVSDLDRTLTSGGVLPLLGEAVDPLLSDGRWDVVIDAQMAKRSSPMDRRAAARMVVGLGPGFEAGANCHVAIETQWGNDLGKIIHSGSTNVLAGEPRIIDGVGRERMIYAPVAGRVKALRVIGEQVVAGDVLIRIDGLDLPAPRSGTLRGILRDGLEVSVGDKLAEVDPRSPADADVTGLGQRPRTIAEGVLSAIEGAPPPIGFVFRFEAEFWPDLHCMPMLMRYKLDTLVFKISLTDWQALPSRVRRELLLWPCRRPDERNALATALQVLFPRYGIGNAPAVAPKLTVPLTDRLAERVVEAAKAIGLPPPTELEWEKLATLQRFALIKLARPDQPHRNFSKAMQEFGVGRTS